MKVKDIIFNEIKCILLGKPANAPSRLIMRYILIGALNFFPQRTLNRISNRVWKDESAILWLKSKISSVSFGYIPERHGFILDFINSDDYRMGTQVIEFGAGTADIAQLVKRCDQMAQILGINLTPCPSYAPYGQHVTGSVGDAIQLIDKLKIGLFISLGSLMYITRSDLKEVFLSLKRTNSAILLLEPHVGTRFGLRPNPFCFNHDYRDLLQCAGFSIRTYEVIDGDSRTKLYRVVATAVDS
jgi:hypothetical protein